LKLESTIFHFSSEQQPRFRFTVYGLRFFLELHLPARL